MGKNKNNKVNQVEQLTAFLTDAEAKSKGIPTWLTGGTPGREPVGNLMGAYKYLGNTDEQRQKLGLEKGEINPYLMSEVEGQDPSKSMYEYWASDAMPQLPKNIRKQYDVVFAGTRPREARDYMWNTKFGDALAPPEEQNIWKFVPKKVVAKENNASDISPIAQQIDQELEGDRPVSIGTYSYTDPFRSEAGQEFLSRYVRTTGLPALTS